MGTVGTTRTSFIRHYSDEIPDVNLSEIRMVLQHLKNGKSPGEDGITAELLKASGKPVLEEVQVDVISPKLFTAVLENFFKLLDWNGYGININGEYITHLRFADDIVLIVESLEDLSTMLNDLNSVFQRISLKMNMDKTKIMCNLHVTPMPVVVGSTKPKLLTIMFIWDK